MRPKRSILSRRFFRRDSRLVALELLGQHLVHELPTGERLVARIVETEAYRQHDPACHAYHLRDGMKPGPSRAAFLFGEPGLSYIYLCYGMYWLLNVITEPVGQAGAVLIRAVEPVAGAATMAQLRARRLTDPNICNGPGKLTLAMGIASSQHGDTLTEPPLYFERSRCHKPQIVASPRVGISAGQDLYWRFFDENSPYVSKAKENSLAQSPSNICELRDLSKVAGAM